MIGIITDIHGNLPAFEAILADAKKHSISHWFHLGDVVGYGPFPEECAKKARELADYAVLGNHDVNCLNGEDYADSLRPMEQIWYWSKHQLSEDSLHHFAQLRDENSYRIETTLGEREVTFSHASPVNSVLFPYIKNIEDARETMMYQKAVGKIHFVGHTHVGKIYSAKKGELLSEKSFPHRFVDDSTALVSCRSGGYPRDGNPDVSYTTYDEKTQLVREHNVSYDVDAVFAEMEKREGFPIAIRHSTLLEYGGRFPG